jgi:hypothetical protein
MMRAPALALLAASAIAYPLGAETPEEWVTLGGAQDAPPLQRS